MAYRTIGFFASTHAMAYDAVRDPVVMYGGIDEEEDSGIVWEWDGNSWSPIIPVDLIGDGHPVACSSDKIMEFDARRDRTVLLRCRTWEWDGNEWRAQTSGEIDPYTSPESASGADLAYDASSALTILFLGDSTWNRQETWGGDGADWTKLAPNDPEGDGDPASRLHQAMAYDRARENVILFGGDVRINGTSSRRRSMGTPSLQTGGTTPWPTTHCGAERYCSEVGSAQGETRPKTVSPTPGSGTGRAGSTWTSRIPKVTALPHHDTDTPWPTTQPGARYCSSEERADIRLATWAIRGRGMDGVGLSLRTRIRTACSLRRRAP